MSNDLESALEAEIVAQELIRLAEKLRARSAQASVNDASEAPPSEPRPRKRREVGETYLSVARQLYRARRQRTEFWSTELFGEPAWDIMLDLYIHACEGRDISVSSACIASCVPATTASRWMNLLESHGLVERQKARHDFRVQYVQLTIEGTRHMQRFLRQVACGHQVEAERLSLRRK